MVFVSKTSHLRGNKDQTASSLRGNSTETAFGVKVIEYADYVTKQLGGMFLVHSETFFKEPFSLLRSWKRNTSFLART